MDRMEHQSRLSPDAAAEVIAVPITFEDLFAAEHEKLFRALYLIVGNTHEAEELMQDAFLGVLERWDRIENPAGYLYRTAMNATRSRFRRMALAAKRTLTPGQPEDQFAAADLRDELVRALKDLPERQRQALVLVDLLRERRPTRIHPGGRSDRRSSLRGVGRRDAVRVRGWWGYRLTCNSREASPDPRRGGGRRA